MPNRSKTPCSKCRVKLIPVGSGGLCEDCSAERKSEYMEHYNKHSRDPAQQQFYNSAKWRRLRKLKMQINPLCEDCSDKGLAEIATVVHHVIARKAGGSDTLDNLMALCFACHEKREPRGR